MGCLSSGVLRRGYLEEMKRNEAKKKKGPTTRDWNSDTNQLNRRQNSLYLGAMRSFSHISRITLNLDTFCFIFCLGYYSHHKVHQFSLIFLALVIYKTIYKKRRENALKTQVIPNVKKRVARCRTQHCAWIYRERAI